jgi:hypothetical protein
MAKHYVKKEPWVHNERMFVEVDGQRHFVEKETGRTSDDFRFVEVGGQRHYVQNEPGTSLLEFVDIPERGSP